MSKVNLHIAGLALGDPVLSNVVQTYETFGGAATLRLARGAGIKQTAWQKLRTTITAAGFVPPALAAVDWSAPVLMACMASRSVASAGPSIVLPAARRADAPPYGFALLPSGRYQAAPVNIVSGNTAELQPVAGAVGYVAFYYPLLSVLSAGPVETSTVTAARASWILEAEEV